MILQPRDHNLLRAISKYSVLSTHQIAKLVFGGIAHTTMMRRLRLLEKGKYIHRGVPLDDGPNTWILGFEGRRLMNQRPSAVFMNRNTIEHDVLMIDVRILLEGMGLANDWTPEWEMKSQAMRNDRHSQSERVIPDGLMIESIKGEAKVIAVELERTRKSAAKYEKILRQYSYKSSIDTIWYVARDLATINAIIKAGSELHFPMSRLWFSIETQLLAQRDQAPLWLPRKAVWIKLNEIGFDRLRTAQPPAHAVSMQSELKTNKQINDNCANSNLENENPHATKNRPSAPDPSPPTSTIGGKGSGATGREEVGENTGEIKKCG